MNNLFFSGFRSFVLFLILKISLAENVIAEEDYPPLKRYTCKVSLQLIASKQHLHLENLSEDISDSKNQQDNYSKLALSNYKHVDKKETTIIPKKPHKITLSKTKKDLQSVEIEVYNFTNNKISLNIKWTNEIDDTLINAKVLVSNGQELVFGAENTKDSSLLLSTKLICES